MEVAGKGAESKSGKRSRREVTADRRQKESTAMSAILDVLPISKQQLEKANQNSLLALTTNYMRVRGLLKRKGKSIVDMKNVSMEEQLMFRGFVLIVDCSRVILYASENITDQLGPYLADVIGQSFCDMLHPTDRRDLEGSCGKCHRGDTRGMFVARMRTSMAPALRSEARMEYKKVFMTTFMKTFGKDASPDSAVGVFLCRTEDLAGFPEIVTGGYMDFVIKLTNVAFTSVDPKTPWLLGYKVEDLIGQHPSTIDHPGDYPSDGEARDKVDELVKSNLMHYGSVKFPKTRVVTAWGEWLWVSVVLSLRKNSSGQADLLSADIRMSILGPVTNGSITHTDRSVQAIADAQMVDGAVTDGMMVNGAETDGMMVNGAKTDAVMAVGAWEPNVPEPLQSYAEAGIGASQVTSADTLLEWDDLVRASDPLAPFSGGLLEAENSSINGSSGYSSNPASPPWPLSATTSSSTSNLWSSSSSPPQWPLSPKEEEQPTCGGYGSPLFTQTDSSEVLYAQSLSVVDVQSPPSQVDSSVDDILFSVLNTPS